MMTRLACTLLLLAALCAPQAALAQAFTPRDESAADYPEGKGRDQAFITCTPCHGFKIVAQQAQTRAQWDDTINFMSQRHNMPKLDGNDRALVLDYLEAAFPPRRAPGGWQNPFQKK